MTLLTGLTEDGNEVPVQVKPDGRLVAEGLQGAPGKDAPVIWNRTGTELAPTNAGDDVFTSGNVKVGGTTVVPKISLKADGSAAFEKSIEGSVFKGKVANGLAFARYDFHSDLTTNGCYILSYGSTYAASSLLNVGAEGIVLSGLAGDFGVNVSSGKTIRFGVNNVERARIDALGNFLIGGSLPSAPKISLKADGSAAFAGTVTATVVPPSDAKFKDNITPAKSQLQDVVALGELLINFDWNTDAPVNEEIRAQRQLGLIAQDAEKICPFLVKTIKCTKQGKELTPETIDADGNVKPATYEQLDDSYKGISHDALLMKLLGAVAELRMELLRLTP